MAKGYIELMDLQPGEAWASPQDVRLLWGRWALVRQRYKRSPNSGNAGRQGPPGDLLPPPFRLGPAARANSHSVGSHFCPGVGSSPQTGSFDLDLGSLEVLPTDRCVITAYSY